MSRSNGTLSCDEPDCEARVSHACTCRICSQPERQPAERYHVCELHRTEVEPHHKRVRGLPPRWEKLS